MSRLGRSRFPDPRRAPGDAALAVGADLSPETLVEAYGSGIFPWPYDGDVWWWSPDPRAIIPLDGLHISRSLRRTLASGRLTAAPARDFGAVIRGCADRPEQGIWITPAMIAAYERLHRLGLAYAVEVRDRDDALVGGIYGVALGGAFMGESMFHRVSDASKVALVELVTRLRAGGFVLFDVQLPTPHLTSMGAVTVSRDAYLDALAAALRRPGGLASSGEGG